MRALCYCIMQPYYEVGQELQNLINLIAKPLLESRYNENICNGSCRTSGKYQNSSYQLHY